MGKRHVYFSIEEEEEAERAAQDLDVSFSYLVRVCLRSTLGLPTSAAFRSSLQIAGEDSARRRAARRESRAV